MEITKKPNHSAYITKLSAALGNAVRNDTLTEVKLRGLQEKLDELDTIYEDQTPEDRSRLLFLQAQIHYFSGRYKDALNFVNAAIEHNGGSWKSADSLKSILEAKLEIYSQPEVTELTHGTSEHATNPVEEYFNETPTAAKRSGLFTRAISAVTRSTLSIALTIAGLALGLLFTWNEIRCVSKGDVVCFISAGFFGEYGVFGSGSLFKEIFPDRHDKLVSVVKKDNPHLSEKAIDCAVKSVESLLTDKQVDDFIAGNTPSALNEKELVWAITNCYLRPDIEVDSLENHLKWTMKNTPEILEMGDSFITCYAKKIIDRLSVIQVQAIAANTNATSEELGIDESIYQDAAASCVTPSAISS